MKNYIKKRYPKFFCLLMLLSIFAACDDFVDVGSPETKVGAEIAFNSDATATSTVLGLYDNAVNNIVPFYGPVMGNSSDELQASDSSYDNFRSNTVSTTGFRLRYNLWIPAYNVIMQANLAIQGLNDSKSLTPSVKDQLLGEAKFMRAFTYFYLVNIFGDVPLPLEPNVIANASLPRSPATEVWNQITKDLTEAKMALGESYPSSSFRTRINKSVATAFLARVYLYQKQWINAEAEATNIINNTDYRLVDLGEKFLNTSEETIWQFYNIDGVSKSGKVYQANEGFLPTCFLTSTLSDSFEPNDMRKSEWVKLITVGEMPFNTIYKYKSFAGTANEYDIVMRLSEQYLIRAEARAQQNKIDGNQGALADLNSIRNKAGLGDLSGLNTAQTLLAVENERKWELFGEWGHRWLDLKRTPSVVDPTLTRADDVLSVLKDAWKPSAILYPIPAGEITLNPKLTQNTGYVN